MSQRLTVALRAARTAGRILHEKYDATREIKSKGKRDIVTDADYAAERAVKSVLMERLPQDRIISEEGRADELAAAWAELDNDPALYGWIVDPLDGTTNYARHQPVFCVSIAMYRAGNVELGVVFDPLRNEMFAAERGKGATLNGKAIAVSSIDNFEDAVIGLEWARNPRLRKRTGELAARMAAHSVTVRSTGSAALELCYVGAGRLETYFHLHLQPWDVAAGALIVEEAGGKVTTPEGAPWDPRCKAYVASNGHLHSTILRYFRS